MENEKNGNTHHRDRRDSYEEPQHKKPVTLFHFFPTLTLPVYAATVMILLYFSSLVFISIRYRESRAGPDFPNLTDDVPAAKTISSGKTPRGEISYRPFLVPYTALPSGVDVQ